MISAKKVKELLGIATTDYDSRINALLPMVRADVCRIMNNRYKEVLYATITAGATTFSAPTGGNMSYGGYRENYSELNNPIEFGRVITGLGVPDDTYVTDFDEENGIATVNNAFTATADRLYTDVSIAQWQTIARMVLYKINQMTTKDVDSKIASKTMSVVSVTYDTSTINKTYGYPQALIDALGTPFASLC